VDDGSVDNSPLICDNYAKVNTRVHVIHKKNGGLSSARNAGLARAKGEYVAFVDGDDYVTNDYIEFLQTLLIENDADISQCGHFIQFSSTRVVNSAQSDKVYILNRIQALESLCYNDVYDVTAWNKLYKRNIFNTVSFPEGWLYEDTATSYLIAEKAQKFAIKLAPKYFYVQRYNSIANGLKFDERKYQFVEVGDKMADYISKKYIQLIPAADVKRCFVRLSTLSQMVNTSHKDPERVRDFKRVINKHALQILRNKKVSKRDKLGIAALELGYPIYSVLWKSYYKFVRRN
jgi:glycosyltransferase involved in cell wall biosynthesis